MIDVDWLWLLLLIPIAYWLRGCYTRSRFIWITAENENDLVHKLSVIQIHRGFMNNLSLQDEEIKVHVTLADPYLPGGRNFEYRYAIEVPKHVLANARYTRSQASLEEIFRPKRGEY